MIARISGTLVYKYITHAIVDSQGVGYRIFIPLTTFYELPDIGESVTLNVHTHVRQDAISLFGFYTQEERDMFQLMIAVSGIGPKLAINILSGISVGELIRAVNEGDLHRMVSIPGVGKKMAERVILELKDKVLKLHKEERNLDTARAPASTEELIKEDALSALVNLGYKSQAASEALEKVIKQYPEDITVEVLLKKTLRVLSGHAGAA
jgi:Holliday junction DNA helicase RuvA